MSSRGGPQQSSSSSGGGGGGSSGASAPAAAGGPPAVASEKLTNKVNGFINEFISEKDKKEALQSFDELPSGPIVETVVTAIVEKVIEGKATERPARVELLRFLASEKRLTEEGLATALFPTIEFMEDIAIDAPNAEKNLGSCLSVLISERALRFPFVMENTRKHCPRAMCKIFASIFKDMLSTSAAPAVRDTMSAQGFELPQIFEKKTDAIAFLEENKLWILQPGLWVMTKAEPKLQDASERPGFLSWTQETVSTDLRQDGVFAETLTRSMLVADKRDVPSSYTLEAVEWACKGGPDLQKGCLWGVYYFYNASSKPTDPMSEASGTALVRAFDRLLTKNIVAKAVLAAWHQQHKSKEKKSLTPAAEAFFKKNVLA